MGRLRQARSFATEKASYDQRDQFALEAELPSGSVVIMAAQNEIQLRVFGLGSAGSAKLNTHTLDEKPPFVQEGGELPFAASASRKSNTSKTVIGALDPNTPNTLVSDDSWTIYPAEQLI